MIRGTAFSAILHGLLLALILFGLPHVMSLVQDDKPESEAAQEQEIRVQSVTQEEAAAIDQAAARPLAQTSISGGGRGLTADALNTENPNDGHAILQSRSAASSGRADQPAVEARSSISQLAPQSPQPETSSSDAIAERAPSEASAGSRASAARPDAAASPPSSASTSSPASAASGAAQASQANEPRMPPRAPAPTSLLPPRSVAAERDESPARPDTSAQSAQTGDAGGPERAASAEQPPSPANNAERPNDTSPASALALLKNDAAAPALRPLIAALPRLDGTLGEIITARSRDATAARAAAESAPALQQSIGRMAAAAEQGYGHAQFALAEIYLTGNGRPRDVERGKSYLQRASLNGYVPAQLLSAALAMEGKPEERDLAEALAWLSAAAERGSKPAAETLQSLEPELAARDLQRARQRLSQLRQVFVLSNTRPSTQDRQLAPDEQLRVATTLGDEQAVYVSLAQGADADKADEDGRSAAIEAAWRGYGKILDQLLEKGANVRSTDGSGKTALMWAAINGHAAVAERLLSAEAQIDAQDQEGMTALMRAAWNGHAGVVRLLLAKRANPNLRDRAGKTALDYANLSRQTEIIALLRSATRS